MTDTAEFATGLLRPELPVPNLVNCSAKRRYDVYRNNVTVGLIRGLEANFPAVRRLLGDAYFAGFARAFSQMHPPQSPLMFDYGADFPEALEQAHDLSPFPYLADVARLEILWRQSYHAADVAPLSAVTLAAVDPELLFECRLVPHPASRLMRSPFAVCSIFAANRSTESSLVVDPLSPQCVLITRPLLEVGVVEISPAQFAFFSALQKSGTLNVALDAAATDDENFDLAESLALLLQSGAFQSIQPSSGKPKS